VARGRKGSSNPLTQWKGMLKYNDGLIPVGWVYKHPIIQEKRFTSSEGKQPPCSTGSEFTIKNPYILLGLCEIVIH
jgi:hypothetical protein